MQVIQAELSPYIFILCLIKKEKIKVLFKSPVEIRSKFKGKNPKNNTTRWRSNI